MNDTTLSLRELFEIDPSELTARVESGIDARHSADSARQEIEKEARSIRWPWVRQAVAAKSHELLDLNVIGVLVDSWKKFMEIQQYTDPKKYLSGEEILAPLVTHTVKSEHHPYVEVLLQQRPVGRVTFDLSFSLILEGFVLKIRDGRIMEILPGSGTGEGTLSLADVSLWDRKLAPVRFPGHLSLGQGIPLRRENASSAAVPNEERCSVKSG